MSVPTLAPVTVLRVGTRSSALARAQSAAIATTLSRALSREAVLVDVSTLGDESTAPLRQIGGTGVFVSALRDALLAGHVDVAVHSLKDLPTAAPVGIDLAAVPRREDPRDALVSRDGLHLHELPAGSRVGTGSPRRAAALASLALDVVDIRGNVDSRLARVGNDLDAVVVALAGLRRLGRAGEATELLDPLVMLPAPGQGALAIETRAGDPLTDLVRQVLDDLDTRLATAAERSVLATLQAGCSAPVGALADTGAPWDAVTGDQPGATEIYLRASLGLPGENGNTWAGVTRASGTAVVTTHQQAQELGAVVATALLSGAATPPIPSDDSRLDMGRR